VKNNYNVFTFKSQRTCFKEITAVLQSLQHAHYILRFRADEENFSISVFLSNELQGDLCIKKVIVIAKNQGVISSKLFKNFIKEDSLAAIFIRTSQSGIVTLKKGSQYLGGGQMLALVK
jgi:ribosomal protein S8